MTETTLRTMVADDIGMGPLAVAERAAVRAILSDLRDRRLLKYLFSDNPDNVGAYGYVEAPIDLQTQHDMVTKWVRLASQSLSTDKEEARSSATEGVLGAHFPNGPWYQPDATWAGYCECGVDFTGANGEAARLAWAAHVVEAFESTDQSHAG